MSTPQTYYRSQHPAVAEMLAEWLRRQDAYHEACEAFEAEFPGSTVVVWQWHSGEHAVGLRAKENPGPLWAQKYNQTYWSPLLRNKDGKALEKRLHALRLDHPKTPGMPTLAHSPGIRHLHALEQVGEEFWVWWTCPADLVEADPAFDGTIWERAKASTFWLAKEAQDALTPVDATPLR